MATSIEKQELVETLKGPHYYRIRIWGYGGESSYMKISKEAHDFWKSVDQAEGDGPLIRYILGAEECNFAEVNTTPEMFEDYDEFNPSTIPDGAKFMHDLSDPEAGGYTWYEPCNEIDHVWGASADNAKVSIEKVDSNEYNAKWIEDVVDEELYELTSRLDEECDYNVDHCIGLEDEPKWPESDTYTCQMYSSEKGTFFEARFETPALIDLQKLQFVIDEALNGEDTVFGVKYDGVELDNDGGDTNGKGYYASVWKNQ